MTKESSEPPKRPPRPTGSARHESAPSAEAAKSGDPDKDWKLPDPTQKKRSSHSAAAAASTKPAAEAAGHPRPSRTWALVFGLVAIALSGSLFAAWKLRPLIRRTFSATAEQTAWVEGPQAAAAFDNQWKRIPALGPVDFVRVSEEYWQYDLSERQSGYSASGDEFQQKKQELWRSFSTANRLFGLDVRPDEFLRAIRSAEGDKVLLQTAVEERRLQDGGLRMVAAKLRFRLPPDSKMRPALDAAEGGNGARMRLMFSPYGVGAEATVRSVNQRELPPKFQGPLSRVNSLVTLEDVSVIFDCDFLGLQTFRAEAGENVTVVRR